MYEFPNKSVPSFRLGPPLPNFLGAMTGQPHAGTVQAKSLKFVKLVGPITSPITIVAIGLNPKWEASKPNTLQDTETQKSGPWYSLSLMR